MTWRVLKETDKFVYCVHELVTRSETYITNYKQRKTLCVGGPLDGERKAICQVNILGLEMEPKGDEGYAFYNRRDSAFGPEKQILVWFSP